LELPVWLDTDRAALAVVRPGRLITLRSGSARAVGRVSRVFSQLPDREVMVSYAATTLP